MFLRDLAYGLLVFNAVNNVAVARNDDATAGTQRQIREHEVVRGHVHSREVVQAGSGAILPGDARGDRRVVVTTEGGHARRPDLLLSRGRSHTCRPFVDHNVANR